MAQFPAFPLWTDAYLADTTHLSTTEHGAYLLLLMAMWRAGGHLPNDDKKLARFAKLGPNQWERVKPNIMAFMIVASGGATVTQRRLQDELAYVRENSKKQAGNARRRWENETAPPVAVIQHPESLSDSVSSNPLELLNMGDAVAMPNACQTDAPTPTPTPIERNMSETDVPDPSPKASKRAGYPGDFELAWKAYPTDKNMSKAKALKAWKALAPDDRALVLPSIPSFLAYCKTNPTYRPVHFVRYLSERRFEGHAPSGHDAGSSATPDWNKRLTWGRDRGTWSLREWGPMPGQPGCAVPPDLLRAGDGEGWVEHRLAVA